MSEYIIKLPNGGAADECIRLRGYEKSLYGYELHEEIVRCSDCEFYQRDMYIHFTCEYLQRKVIPDDFCVWGERKERIES